MRRIWTNCPTVRRLATTMLAGAALLVACDRAGERTPTASPPGGMRREVIAQSTDVDWTQLVDLPLLTSTVLSLNDPSAAAEELPGLGQKFQLFFTMKDDRDPDNLTNDVISDFTTPTSIAVAYRNLPPGITIDRKSTRLNSSHGYISYAVFCLKKKKKRKYEK